MKDLKASCYNQKFGHNFPYSGSNCVQCRVNQKELIKPIIKRSAPKEYKIKKAEKGIHSETHALAKEVSEYCNEPKKFAMYLGIIKNIGLKKAYQIFSEIKQNKKVKTPGKLFIYMSAFKKINENENYKRTRNNT